MEITADIDISEIVDEVVESYVFDRAVHDVVSGTIEDAVSDALDSALRKALVYLTERVATLEAALAAAGKSLQEPAKRVLHGVEVSQTTTGVF